MESLDKQIFHVSRWIISTFLGWILGFLVILILAVGLDSIGIGNLQFFIGAGIGTGVGFMQWRTIRSFVNNKKWIWYSAFGLTIPFLIFDLLNILNFFHVGDYGLPLSTGLGGLIVGSLQFLILKDVSQKATLWILGSFIAWILAAFTVFFTSYTKALISNNFVGFAINIILILGGGVVLGITTAVLLKKILEAK